MISTLARTYILYMELYSFIQNVFTIQQYYNTHTLTHTHTHIHTHIHTWINILYVLQIQRLSLWTATFPVLSQKLSSVSTR